MAKDKIYAVLHSQTYRYMRCLLLRILGRISAEHHMPSFILQESCCLNEDFGIEFKHAFGIFTRKVI